MENPLFIGENTDGNAPHSSTSRSAGKDGYRDRLHDPHNVDIDRCLVFRRDFHRESSLARVPVPRLSRASVATCWKNCLIGTAGEPQTSSPAETSRIAPLGAATRAPAPSVK